MPTHLFRKTARQCIAIFVPVFRDQVFVPARSRIDIPIQVPAAVFQRICVIFRGLMEDDQLFVEGSGFCNSIPTLLLDSAVAVNIEKASRMASKNAVNFFIALNPFRCVFLLFYNTCS